MNPAPAGTGVPTQIGPYRIEREIARGGMGIVYLARDTRLDRAAAIKALPEDVAGDPDRLARFEREAKVLASLNHPNVAGIYGVEESGGRRYLALEHVEGETLAARIARGPLPLAETLEICSQIAAGIEAAHESGVIHRDLKPGNVMITPGEHVKVLDFGLAKGKVADESSAMRAGPLPDSPTLSSPTLPHSPTMHSPATLPGVILGTAAYLSPEQARGKAVDRRTDIWSFGCVLYECLTGKRAFEGETVSDTIAKILERDVDWGRLPKSTPPRIRELLQRCFEKDARKRLRDIGEARLAIEDVRAGRSAATGVSGVATPPAPTTLIGRGREAMRSHGFLFALGLVAGALLALNMWGGRGSSARHAIRGVMRVSIPIPPELRAIQADLTPDGRTEILLAATRTPTAGGESRTLIYLRPMDRTVYEPIRGTEGATSLVVSRDGRWIAFRAPLSERIAQFRLMKVPVSGGAPPTPVMSWGDDWQGKPIWLESGDMIVLVNAGREFRRLPMNGGPAPKPRKVDTAGFQGDLSFAAPLPGDRWALLEANYYEGGAFHLGIAAIDLGSGKAKILVTDGGNPRYLPTGHLLYSRGGVLYAAPFDPAKPRLTGEPIAIMSGLRAVASWTNAAFDVSENGILQAASGGTPWENRRAVIVDAHGTVSEWSPDRQAFEVSIAVSPDGSRFAGLIASPKTVYEIWVSERGRPSSRRVVSVAGADAASPVWSPDGSRIAYGQQSLSEANGIYVASSSGSGPHRRISRAEAKAWIVPTSWSADGKQILCKTAFFGRQQMFVTPASPPGETVVEAKPLFSGTAQYSDGMFSPDGRWIAYQSDESGKDEVYVTAWTAGGPDGEPLPVSVGGGSVPIWAPGGKGLYYFSPDRKVMSVSITRSPRLTASTPSVAWDLEALGIVGSLCDILPDGRLLAIQKAPGEDEISRFDLTVNFFDELQERLAAAKK